MSKLKNFADEQMNDFKNMKFVFRSVENVGTEIKLVLQAFPLQNIFEGFSHVKIVSYRAKNNSITT